MKKKSVIDMTVDEFSAELARLRDDVFNIKDSRVGTRTDRSYLNQKRGNFHGNVQKNARSQLQELGINVKSDGKLKNGKWNG